MSDIKMLTHDTMPCWYELSFNRHGEPGLLFRLHSEIANHEKRIQTGAPVVKHMRGELGLAPFQGAFGKDFGFGGALKFLGITANFLEYSIPTPLCRKRTGKKCPSCKGTGQDEILENSCLYCEDGDEIRYDYQEAYTVCASLSLILFLAEFSEIQTNHPDPQLLTVRTMVGRGQQGTSLGGSYSKELVSYLRKRLPGNFVEITTAMQTVWKSVEGRVKSFDKHSFRAFTHGNDGRLIMSCPGDAAELHPADYPDENFGYKFTSHNIDNPMQQLALLGALGALHDAVRMGS